MILTGTSVTVAQETAGRATLSDPAEPTPPRFLSGPVPDAVPRFTPEPGRPAMTAPLTGSDGTISDRSKTSVTASASKDVYQEADAAPLAIQDAPVPADTWQEEYSGHVDDVLNGGASRSHRGTVGDWWRQRLPYVEFVPVEPGQLKASAQDFINEHTLPPEHDYDIDVYDQKPISVASSQTVTTVRPLAANEDDAQAQNNAGENRLRTDIRKIRPTLGYAMRNIKPGELPEGFNEKLDEGDYIARQSSPAVLQWAPTNLYHYPLYFEDPSLERYGHTYHPVVQPFASAGRFATQLVGLPYQMTLHPVHSREYTLGYYRPGECAPKKFYQIPFNEEAAIMQAAAMAGFFLIFP
ncbi:MAG: hypothetical protein WKF77_14640 [Planctomycetaceae bacterium]